MNKELEELKNLVHALEERISQSTFNSGEINLMLTEIHKIQLRLNNLKKEQSFEQEDKKAA